MILTIEHQCPQCGAPAEFKETDRLFQCEFCRVKSYLTAHGHFKYVLPHASNDSREWIYFPYWRFKGMLFACTGRRIEEKFVDISCQALHSHHFPVSLGVRSQALKLRFLTPEHQGNFLQVVRSEDSAIESYQNQLVRYLKGDIHHQAHIGESLSLIYAPYYLDNGLIDGVLDQPLSSANVDLNDLPSETPQPHLRFLPTLCPACGWDLNGNADAQVLFCFHCRTTWLPAGSRFRQLPTARLQMDQADDEETLYLPFWRIRPKIEGLQLAHYADLVKVANLPLAPPTGMGSASILLLGSGL